MQQQNQSSESVDVQKPQWQVPELVVADVSSTTLAGTNPGSDGTGAFTLS